MQASVRTKARKGANAPRSALSTRPKKPLCGAWTLKGIKPTGVSPLWTPRNAKPELQGNWHKFARLHCKCWSCSRCGPRKASHYHGCILGALVRHKLTRFMTLTLDPRKLMSDSEAKTFYAHFEKAKLARTACDCDTCTRVQVRSIKHIRKCWSKLRVYLLRHCGQAPTYVQVIEFQRATGLAHIHIAIDRYIEQDWAKKAWSAVGGGEHVHIQHVDVHRSAAYLSKYLSKNMLLNASVGLRRVTTSRSIKLNEKKVSEFEWRVLKTAIDYFYARNKGPVIRELRSEGELMSFEILE